MHGFGLDVDRRHLHPQRRGGNSSSCRHAFTFSLSRTRRLLRRGATLQSSASPPFSNKTSMRPRKSLSTNRVRFSDTLLVQPFSCRSPPLRVRVAAATRVPLAQASPNRTSWLSDARSAVRREPRRHEPSTVPSAAGAIGECFHLLLTANSHCPQS